MAFKGCDIMTVKEMRAKTGLSQAQFAKLLGIPKRTIENWDGGKSNCHEYTIKLIDYFLTHEGLYNKE